MPRPFWQATHQILFFNFPPGSASPPYFETFAPPSSGSVGGPCGKGPLAGSGIEFLLPPLSKGKPSVRCVLGTVPKFA